MAMENGGIAALESDDVYTECQEVAVQMREASCP